MVTARSSRWVWVGRGVFGVIVVGLVVYLFAVGLDKADKVGSSIGGVVGVAALVAPYLLAPGRRRPDGTAEGGAANTDAETEQADAGTGSTASPPARPVMNVISRENGRSFGSMYGSVHNHEAAPQPPKEPSDD